MKSKRQRMLAASLLIMMSAFAAGAATIYVQPDRPGASDRHPGTRPIQPLKTMARAAELAAPGDEIRVLRSEPTTFYVDQNHPEASDENPGTVDLPLLTIQHAAERVRPGDTVKIRPGRYREGIVMYQPGVHRAGEQEAARITFEADIPPGSEGEQVVLDGSWRVPDESWHLLEGHTNVCTAELDRPPVYVERGRTSPVPAPRPHWVFVNDNLLLPHSVPGKRDNAIMVTDETVDRWYCDHEQSLLYVNLGGKKPSAVDVSVRLHAFGGWKPCDYSTFRGLTFQRYSHGALYGGMKETWVEDCLFRHNRMGIGGGDGGHVFRCTFIENDQTSIYGGFRMLYADNLVIRYYFDTFRTRDYYASCAIKAFGGDYLTIRDNVLVDEGPLDRGYGGCGALWFDVPSAGNFVYGNTISDSHGMGMYIEALMVGAVITMNTVSDTGEGIVLRFNAANNVFENYVKKAHTRAFKLQTTSDFRGPRMAYNHIAGNYIENCGVGIAAGPQAGSTNIQQVNFANGNIYNLQSDQPVAHWAGTVYDTVEEFRQGAGMESLGRAGKLTEEELGLVSFRVGDSRQPGKVLYRYGNPHLERYEWAAQTWGRLHSNQLDGNPFFFEPGVGTGETRDWYHGFQHHAWPRDRNWPGRSWRYTSTAPFNAMVVATCGTMPARGLTYMPDIEQRLRGHTPGRPPTDNAHLQVMAKGPEGAPAEGNGWFTCSMPTAGGAVIDIGLWMQLVQVQPVDGRPDGGAMVFVEWSDYTRSRVARSFIVGRDDQGRERQPELVVGDWPEYRRVEGTVTAPDWAKRFRLFMGMRSASGAIAFDDIDTIRTRPESAEAEVTMKQTFPPPPVDPSGLRFSVVNLSHVVNRSLADDFAGDGKGGWTDEGPDRDMRSVAPGRRTFRRVPFDILQPNSLVVLKSPRIKGDDLPNEVSIPLKPELGKKVQLLCFLHALSGEDGKEHWRYVIHYDDDSRETIPIIEGKNIRHWTGIADAQAEPGQWRASAAETVGGPVFVRMSLWVLEWKNPHPDRSIERIDMVAANHGVPILLGITVGQER